MERKTPLYDIHVEEGGKIVPFAGYLLPVQYGTGIIAEHEAVRTQVGLFDVSHMGEVLFTGPGALATINHLFTNDYTDMPIGRVRYGVMCNEHGGCIDDLIVYKFGEEEYFVVVNASNREKDVAHMEANLLPDTSFEDLSDGIAELALQGPLAKDVMAKLCDIDQLPKGYYRAVRHVEVAGIDCMVSRTGYTGEFGYELYCAPSEAIALWRALREAGPEFGLIPCGLGARDTLRLEASMPLYGHEMDEDTTPLEAGLNLGVRMNKQEFIGREAILAAGEPKHIRVGLEATGRGIMREHMDVYAGGELVGHTTSGTFAPHLKKAIAMARIDVSHSAVGTELEVEVRGRRIPATIVPMPFYKHA
ncbi:MAG: glycine cleavage system aminomethyltransferase GcvT [Coriobacteriales bacterium]|nr:glycine cleavage system aminomethyltransferase GcvT [Coriobacteriales bacterium]